MKTKRPTSSMDRLVQYIVAALTVAGATLFFMLIGREQVGEAVIALLFLVPVSWNTIRYGKGPGIAAAVLAALSFDFFFIPPYGTLAVARLESWLVLAIFLAVAILVVGSIQVSLSKAHTNEHEAVMMYELSATLAGLRTQQAVANAAAQFIQERYLPARVTVVIQPHGQSTVISATEPPAAQPGGKPDRLLPLINNWGLAGEVQIWTQDVALPALESRIFRNFASQIGQAIERTRLIEAGALINAVPAASKGN